MSVHSTKGTALVIGSPPISHSQPPFLLRPNGPTIRLHCYRLNVPRRQKNGWPDIFNLGIYGAVISAGQRVTISRVVRTSIGSVCRSVWLGCRKRKRWTPAGNRVIVQGVVYGWLSG